MRRNAMKNNDQKNNSYATASSSFEAIIADEWATLVDLTPPHVIEIVFSLVNLHFDELIEKYKIFLKSDPLIMEFLQSGELKEQWVTLFSDWVTRLFSMKYKDVSDFIEDQNEMGQKLSRVGYPTHAATKALRIIKSWILYHIMHSPWQTADKIQSVLYITNLIGISFEIRNLSFMKGVSDQIRLDETYRLAAIGNNIAMERERQRAFLSEWEKAVYAWLYHHKQQKVTRLSKSEFGMWFTHKAGLIFERSTSIDTIPDLIQRIDNEILPGLELAVNTAMPTAPFIELMQNELSEIKFVMNEIFEAHLEFENAKDVLTKLLNRRFMHTVLSREMALQRKIDSVGFGILILDLDHFKRINDTYGHAAGDIILQRTASLITNTVKTSDFIFRYGGEEILIVLAEIEPPMMKEIAEKIRIKIQQHQFDLPSGDHISITVSIGGAHAKGKFDYQEVINEADQALYVAKKQGRNQVSISASHSTAEA